MPTSFKPSALKQYALALCAGAGLVSPASAVVAEMNPETAVEAPTHRAELDTFRYDHFANRTWELGLPRQWLGFTVKVGTDGKIIDCTFDRSFRSAFTPIELCDHLRQSMTFRSARDAAGNPVVDEYSNKVQIVSLIWPIR